MNETDLELRLREHVCRPNYRPVKPRVIAKQLDIEKTDKSGQRELRRALKRLIKRGTLRWGSGHLVEAGKPSQSPTIQGTFRRVMAGYGFVRPSDAVVAKKLENDIHIPADATIDAASGDTVMIRLRKRPGPGGRRSGEIVEILERDKHQFVGTYFVDEGKGWVRVDGKVFQEPVLVGDPGAKNARQGMKVVIEMVLFPSHVHDGEGVIVEVLGEKGAPGVDTLMVLREYNLPDEFPEEVLAAARVEAEKFEAATLDGRLDLTEQTIITIDPKTARDFDDAISLEQLEGGHWRLGVHIADVSHFVPQGSTLDREAHNRSTSVYLPDQVIPMLPEVISNNLASLQPDKVRFTKTALIEFTADGARVNTEVRSTAIKSVRRFTYEEVDAYIAKPDEWKEKLSPEVFDLLGRMRKLAMILRGRRSERGAIELSMPEVKLELDDDNRVVGARVEKQTESHQIIEEFMLSANEAVAEMIRDKEIPFLRRIHESPDPLKLDDLTTFVRELGIETENLQSRFAIQSVLRKIKDTPQQRAVNYATLRSMRKATYSPAEEGHYALASDCYCHFTSPIRRYPDLTIHRTLTAMEHNRPPASDVGLLLSLGQHCSDREHRAVSAERESTKLKMLQYLSERIGLQMDAVITGVNDFGVFAQGVELPAEGLIQVRSLMSDHYTFDKTTHTLSGKRAGNVYRLGDLIRIEIARVDVDRRLLDMRFVRRVSQAESGFGSPASEKRERSKSSSKSHKKPKGKKMVARKGGAKGKKRK